jgi:hypothetical protein
VKPAPLLLAVGLAMVTGPGAAAADSVAGGSGRFTGGAGVGIGALYLQSRKDTHLDPIAPRFDLSAGASLSRRTALVARLTEIRFGVPVTQLGDRPDATGEVRDARSTSRRHLTRLGAELSHRATRRIVLGAGPTFALVGQRSPSRRSARGVGAGLRAGYLLRERRGPDTRARGLALVAEVAPDLYADGGFTLASGLSLAWTVLP